MAIMPAVDIPGSKSVTARALFLAAAADGVSTSYGPCAPTTPRASPRA